MFVLLMILSTLEGFFSSKQSNMFVSMWPDSFDSCTTLGKKKFYLLFSLSNIQLSLVKCV